MRSAQLTPDGRTLVLATDPLSRAVHYASDAARHGPTRRPTSRAVTCRSTPAIDLDFDLTGCEATWTPADGGADVDRLAAAPRSATSSRQFTAGSAPHDALWAALEGAGRARRCAASST